MCIRDSTGGERRAVIRHVTVLGHRRDVDTPVCIMLCLGKSIPAGIGEHTATQAAAPGWAQPEARLGLTGSHGPGWHAAARTRVRAAATTAAAVAHVTLAPSRLIPSRSKSEQHRGALSGTTQTNVTASNRASESVSRWTVRLKPCGAATA
eukprot:1528126-Rhodomonas_salina.2